MSNIHLWVRRDNQSNAPTADWWEKRGPVRRCQLERDDPAARASLFVALLQ
jgi:hypothetical protein